MTRADAVSTASAVLSELAAGTAPAEVARRLGISRQRVSAIAKAAGLEPRAAGRRPSDAITGDSQRGRALLAQLVADATSAELTPEQYLADVRDYLAEIRRLTPLFSK
jgi:hypothetical protein